MAVSQSGGRKRVLPKRPPRPPKTRSQGDTGGTGGGEGSAPPADRRTREKDLRQQALAGGFTAGEASRLASSHWGVDVGQPGSIDMSRVVAGYKLGQGGQDSAAGYYSPQDVSGEFEAPGGSDEWWTGSAKRSESFAGVANALLPYLAPENQKLVRDYLSENYADTYGSYANVDTPGAPIVTSEMRKNYYSSERAKNAKVALENMLAATQTSADELGPGYKFLTDVIAQLEEFGGSNAPMSRAQYNEFSKKVDSLLKTASDNPDLQPYEPLARFFAKPTSGGSSIMDIQQNKKLFG